MMDKRDEQAENRTDWAEDRTILANERTFASWVGTGMGGIGIAIALKAVFGGFDPTWVPKTVASVFLITAIVIFWAARLQAQRTLGRLNQHQAENQPSRNFTGLAVILTLATLGTGGILWLL